MYTRTSITKLLILSTAMLLLVPTVVFAAPSWWPLVPCGTSVNPEPCNPCELFHLGRNIIDFVLMGLMPPVAAGLFIWGGFLILMGGANPALLSRGKEIFKTTFYGVLVILASWLITNTILMSVAQDSITLRDGTVVNIVTDWNKFECTYTEQGTTSTTGDLTISPDTLPNVTPGQYYSQTISVSGGQTPYDWSATDASGLPGGFSFDDDDGKIYGQTAQTTGSFTFTAQVKDSTSPTPLTGSKTYALKISATTACDGATLAQKYGVPYERQNAPELDELISCVNSKLSNMIDQNQIYTYERTNDLCNYTRGNPVCGPCAHYVNSCHYGGSNGTQGALGVDFNAKAPYTETQLNTELEKIKATCNFGFIELETSHTHISSMGCDKN